MNFPRIDTAMKACKEHLVATGTLGTEIESYLVAFLLVAIVSEFEERFEAIAAKRVARVPDPHIQRFAAAAVARVVRSPKINELNGFLKMFGEDCRDAFKAKVSGTPMEAAYGNILENRMLIAHKFVTNMTFSELESAYPDGVKVVSAVAEALGLTTAELADWT